MRALAAVTAAAAALAIAAAHGQMPKKDNPACKDANPVFAKFPGAFTMTCDRSRFSKLEVFQAKDAAKPEGDYSRVPKEGEYWYFIEQIVPDAQKRYPSQLEVFRNFETALKQAGGTPLWHDGARAIHYRITRPSGEYWGIAGCSGGSSEQCDGVLHKIVRIAAMEQSVVVNADQIQRSLADAGKVVFYGIYFDTDKAVVKPESGPTLEQMAKFLKANAAATVFIVGHTDNQGALERNQKLARDRAAAVVAALAASHGVAKERMVADGVGPLAPVAANDTEAGRAKNRRVEMVMR
jgi:outer membrane protein OmpA-like peptidoglycan-associated protein